MDNEESRFWLKVKIVDNGCWEWQASLTEDGYGTFTQAHSVNSRAHRWCYEKYVGLIPPGLELDHLCRNRKCVNPLHLEPVTHRENARRGNSISGINSRKTHCKRGHLLQGENLIVHKNNSRQCRTCKRLSQ